MLGKNDRFDDIDRYVKGEMSDKECETFESEVQCDEELRARLHVVQDLKEGLQRRAEKLEQINRWNQDAAQKQQKRPRRFIMTGISAAAAVALVVTLSLPRSGEVSQQPSFVIPSRGSADVDVNGYWEAGKYEECMYAIEVEVAKYQDAIQELIENFEQGLCPEKEYDSLFSDYTTDLDYLNWANILTLYKMGRYDEALEEVNAYLETGVNYLEEAEELYEQLTK